MKVFKDCGLRITIQANLQTVNFLDVQLNLDTSTHQPHRKPYNNPVYLNKNPITPQLIQINRKTCIRYIMEWKSFTQSVTVYQDVLQKSGFKEQEKKRNGAKEKSSGSICRIQWT